MENITADKDDGLTKKIKKHLYSKPQSIIATCLPGFTETALSGTKAILSSLWFPQKYQSEIEILKNSIHISNIHLFAAIELLLRNQCFSDLRLVIFEGKTSGKLAFKNKLTKISWEYFLSKNMAIKIKVDSVASRAFHETGLKEIAAEIIKPYVKEIVSGENANETTTLYINLLKDRLTVSISLAGEALYKRGYRQILSASAPLREDAAASCIRKSFDYAKSLKLDIDPKSIVIPFSGTGTFVFEFLLYYLRLSPALLNRNYALQQMPLFREEHFNFLKKKALELAVRSIETTSEMLFESMDISENALNSLKENNETFIKIFSTYDINIRYSLVAEKADFFAKKINPKLLLQDVFIPLNPPYGVRLGKNLDSTQLFRKIAKKLNELANQVKQNHKNLFGFVLCPTEDTWAAFVSTLTTQHKQTYHFNQGGLDIRVCQFFY